MNRLDSAARTQILNCLVEGNSIMATCRITGASKRAVSRLLVDAGRVCAAYQDEVLRDLPSKRVQVDEIWAFVYAKQKNVAAAKAAPEWAGDVWTWVALDADHKLAISWLVGGRDAEYAHAFINDTYQRLANRVQLTSDGHSAYFGAMQEVFGLDVDYAQLVKHYGAAPESALGRYSPAECTGISKRVIVGNPDPAHVSTSYVERQNLTMRMAMRRFTRLSNGFSKKIENHAHAVALHFMHYNFCRIHKSLRVTPAMSAGVTNKLWSVSDIVALVEAADAQPKKRGPYKKRAN